jgi:hypothetical protein
MDQTPTEVWVNRRTDRIRQAGMNKIDQWTGDRPMQENRLMDRYTSINLKETDE